MVSQASSRTCHLRSRCAARQIAVGLATTLIWVLLKIKPTRCDEGLVAGQGTSRHLHQVYITSKDRLHWKLIMHATYISTVKRIPTILRMTTRVTKDRVRTAGAAGSTVMTKAVSPRWRSFILASYRHAPYSGVSSIPFPVVVI